jgi:hypothetical protein
LICLTPTADKLVLLKVVPTAIRDHYMILIVRKINIYYLKDFPFHPTCQHMN